MKATLRFPPTGGLIRCLHTEAIDLRALGRLQVVRATRIEFDGGRQCWRVRCASTGAPLFADPSRSACLRWESEHLLPGPAGPVVVPDQPPGPGSP